MPSVETKMFCPKTSPWLADPRPLPGIFVWGNEPSIQHTRALVLDFHQTWNTLCENFWPRWTDISHEDFVIPERKKKKSESNKTISL